MLFMGFEGVDGIGLEPAVPCDRSGEGLRGSRALPASWITKINYKEPPPGVEGYVNTKRFVGTSIHRSTTGPLTSVDNKLRLPFSVST